MKLDISKENFQELLQMLNDAGFQTNKGSNTHTLALVVHDYVERVLDARKKDLSVLSLWDTQDINLLAPLLFDRYRIYNTRHIPRTYDVRDLDVKPRALKLREQISGFSRLCYIGDDKCIAATPRKFNISRLDNEKPTRLGVKYDAIYEGSYCTLNDRELHESTMTTTGVYLEGDFVILPDEEGDAFFYPITNFKTISQTGEIKLTLFVNTGQRDFKLPEITPIREFTEISCDLLRFTLTQLMQSFPKYRGLTLEQFQDYIALKYDADAVVLENDIVVDLDYADLKDLQVFASKNLYGDYKIRLPKVSIVVLKNEKYQNDISKFVKEKIADITESEKLKEQVYYWVDMYYAFNFGLDANFVKSKHPTTIEIYSPYNSSDDTTERLTKVVIAESDYEESSL